MLEQFIYRNHMNETLEFGSDKIFVNENDLHDFTWEVTNKNSRISKFSRGIITKSLPVIIKTQNEEEGIKIRNELFEVAEKDVLMKQHGRIILGDYYMKCFITASKKSNYLSSRLQMNTTLTVTTDFPSWIKETRINFNYGPNAPGKSLDFKTDFPYDYSSNVIGQSVNNTGIVPAEFKLNIYGPAVEPSITIGGHLYSVHLSIENNEYISIDSKEKTVILTKADGSTESLYHYRERDSYVFEKIPVGENNVSNTGEFKFDITLMEERSEPKWI